MMEDSQAGSEDGNVEAAEQDTTSPPTTAGHTGHPQRELPHLGECKAKAET